MSEPMYVIVEFRPNQPGRFRRRVHYIEPVNIELANEQVEHLRDIAERGGRRDDTYEVYELVKQGAIEEARRAGREDAARDIEAAAELLMPKFAPPDEVTRLALLTAQRAAEIARGQNDAGTVTHAGYPGSGLARCGTPVGALTVAPGEPYTCAACAGLDPTDDAGTVTT